MSWSAVYLVSCDVQSSFLWSKLFIIANIIVGLMIGPVAWRKRAARTWRDGWPRCRPIIWRQPSLLRFRFPQFPFRNQPISIYFSGTSWTTPLFLFLKCFFLTNALVTYHRVFRGVSATNRTLFLLFFFQLYASFFLGTIPISVSKLRVKISVRSLFGPY